jgi:iron-sulfur cluster-binding protein
MIPYQEVRALALESGLDDVGISRASAVEGVAEQYREWLAMGYHGEMDYLARNFDKRMEPRLLVPGAKTVISGLLSYNLPPKYLLTTPPKVSRYALLRDYHKLLKSSLFTLLNRLRAQYGAVEGRPFVDSAPFLDRYWAVLGGLGWIGKNGLLISPRWGSFVFIGALVVTLEVEPREGAMPARCGKCTRCLDACPTKALLQPALLDARRCISYLTIEKKSPLTEGERALLDGWAYGCDVCQMVCPWNRRAARSGLEREVLIDRGLLDAYAQGKADLPPDSPMRRANPARLRELLGGGREGLEGITLPARER